MKAVAIKIFCFLEIFPTWVLIVDNNSSLFIEIKILKESTSKVIYKSKLFSNEINFREDKNITLKKINKYRDLLNYPLVMVIIEPQWKLFTKHQSEFQKRYKIIW